MIGFMADGRASLPGGSDSALSERKVPAVISARDLVFARCGEAAFPVRRRDTPAGVPGVSGQQIDEMRSDLARPGARCGPIPAAPMASHTAADPFRRSAKTSGPAVQPVNVGVPDHRLPRCAPT